MEFRYMGYTGDRNIVSGTLAAASEEAAMQALTRQGYRVLSLKPKSSPVFSWQRLSSSMFKVKPEVIVLFSRQLALLLESGTNLVAALELLQTQASSHRFAAVLSSVAASLRSGERLSTALSKYPKVFPPIYLRAASIAEESGNMETVLRQIADYIEKETATKKRIKSALTYPALICVVAVAVIATLVFFVIPAFSSLYASLGAELPRATSILLTSANWLRGSAPYLFGGLTLSAVVFFSYVRTRDGKYQWHKLLLRLPLIGRVNQLNELARCCRSISLLFRTGLSLPESLSLVIEASGNKAMATALEEVRQEMIKGEGLSQPMERRRLFLPMMVQMVRVGEETGNLDVTLAAVADSYEIEAEDRTRSLIAVIQPALTLIIGLTVAFITVSLVSAMYSIYGQML